MLLSSADLGGELQRRGVSSRGQSGFKVDGSGRGIGACALVGGLGFFASGHHLAVGVLAGNGLAVGLVHDGFGALLGLIQEAVGLRCGIRQDPRDLVVACALCLHGIVVRVLTSRERALLGQRAIVGRVRLSTGAQLRGFLVRQGQDGDDACAKALVGGCLTLQLHFFGARARSS